MEELTSLLRRIHLSGAEFVVIGGIAAVKHGVTLGTFDVDICTRFTPENLRRIESAIKDLKPKFSQRKDLPFVLSDELLMTLKNLYVLTNLGRLDCLSEVAGIGDFDAVLKESEPTTFDFGVCRILTIEALIRAKDAIGRDKDKMTAVQLRAIKEKRDQQES